MRIISFAETTEAFLSGHKDVTRRDWAEQHARGFHPGDLVQAWDKSPRSRGIRIGTIRIQSVTHTHAHNLPADDWEGEGFAYMAEHGITLFGKQTPLDVWTSWRRSTDAMLYVVRFEVVEAMTVEEWRAARAALPPRPKQAALPL